MGFVEVLRDIPQHLALLAAIRARGCESATVALPGADRLSRASTCEWQRRRQRRAFRCCTTSRRRCGRGAPAGLPKLARGGHEGGGDPAVRGGAAAAARDRRDVRRSSAARPGGEHADRAAARAALGLPAERDACSRCFPGSRAQEIERHLDDFVAHARELLRAAASGPRGRRERGAARDDRRRRAVRIRIVPGRRSPCCAPPTRPCARAARRRSRRRSRDVRSSSRIARAAGHYAIARRARADSAHRTGERRRRSRSRARVRAGRAAAWPWRRRSPAAHAWQRAARAHGARTSPRCAIALGTPGAAGRVADMVASLRRMSAGRSPADDRPARCVALRVAVARTWRMDPPRCSRSTWRVRRDRRRIVRRDAAREGRRSSSCSGTASCFRCVGPSRNERVAVLISEHGDGEIIARIATGSAIETVRGSTSRGGGAPLLDSAQRARSGGHDVAITPDGPRGPRQCSRPARSIVAQRTARRSSRSRRTASRAWRLTSLGSASRSEAVRARHGRRTRAGSVVAADNARDAALRTAAVRDSARAHWAMRS